MQKLYWEILDKKRQNLLPRLTVFKKDFYLAGGTALALYLGHRDSVDFDFFSPKDFNHQELEKFIKSAFKGLTVKIKFSKKNTITLAVDEVDMSFFKLDSLLLEPLCETAYFNMASLTDIGCMKLNAILGRSVIKDYVDLYIICKNILSLPQLLQRAKIKYPTVESGAFIRALGYYGDVEQSKLVFKNNFFVSLKMIEKYFSIETKKILNIR